jgi:hypothetical protein
MQGEVMETNARPSIHSTFVFDNAGCYVGRVGTAAKSLIIEGAFDQVEIRPMPSRRFLPNDGLPFHNPVREGLPTVQTEPARSAPRALFFSSPDMQGVESQPATPTRCRGAEADQSGLPAPSGF